MINTTNGLHQSRLHTYYVEIQNINMVLTSHISKVFVSLHLVKHLIIKVLGTFEKREHRGEDSLGNVDE